MKSKAMKQSQELSVSLYDCHTPINRATGKPMFDHPTICFDNEPLARKEAQQKANNFESHLIKIKTARTK